MARNESFFKRLTRLFRSGPSIQRRVKGQNVGSYYDTKLIQGNYGYRAPAPFGFGRENSPFSVLGSYGILDRMARYAEFAEMEYCLHGETKIAVPGGYKTIKELANECEENKNHSFIIYSYDHNKKEIVPALGKMARLTRTDHAYKVTFSSGKEIIGTADHRLMKRDGSYCEIKNLNPGDAMMPFYRRSVASNREEGIEGKYQTIYTVGKNTNSYGWVAEHKILSEFILGRKLKDDEVVHHKNFKPNDNRIENLEVMTAKKCRELHSIILNGKKWDYKTNSNWIDNFKKTHSEWIKKNNPAERKDITFEKILYWCDNNSYNLYKVCDKFNTGANTIKRKLKSKGFKDWVTFAKTYSPGWRNESWNNPGRKNPRFRADVTFGKICDEYHNGITKKQLAENLKVSSVLVNNRLKAEGYRTWTDFVNNYKNHKVVSVEYYGKIDLYDLTVDKYKNFATDSVISHNTPEIASAMDIYSDEIAGSDAHGHTLHIFSDNIQIKRALEELFYDVLNVEFNSRSWARNLVKYGDFFLYNEVLPDIGVINAQPIPVNELEREEGYDEEDPYAVRFKWLTRGNIYLENWQVTHMRILGNDLFLPYGTAILEPARRIWRQLIMMEDAMLVYRVVRSPERRVFYIDVGNIAPNDVPSYMEAAKSTLRSHSVIDRTTGRQDLRYNPLAVDEDYYIPVRGGQSGTKIDTLAGGTHVTATEDVSYIQSKLFAALKVPKPYLNYDENLCLIGNTQIPLLNGDTKTIKELSNMDNLENLWVYSTTNAGKVVPSKITKAWKTKEVTEHYKITLDNGEAVECTNNHPFMMRNGEYKRADKLEVGQSLMPIYRKISSKEKGQNLEGYEMVFDNEKQKWEYTHRMVYNTNIIVEHASCNNNKTKNIVHHRDFCKRNNNPNNLLSMSRKAHADFHKENAIKNLASKENRELLRTMWNDHNSQLRINHYKGVKNSWDGEKGERRRTSLRNANIKYNKIAVMKEALKEIRDKNEPSYDEIVNYISKFTGRSLHFSDVVYHFSTSGPRIKKVIENCSNGEMTWVKLKKKFMIVPSKKAVLESEHLPEYIKVANQCKSIEKFCRKIKVSRNGFYTFLLNAGHSPKQWFKENLSSTKHLYNHKISKIEIIKHNIPIEVFDIRVEGPENVHNFLVGPGIIVHNSSKATLAQEDIRFSRTIGNIQKIVIAELTKLAMIHLFAKGFDGEDLINFDIKLSNPSTVAVQQKLDLWNTKMDIAGTAKETGLVDAKWIQKNILELTEDDIAEISKGLYEDKITEIQLDKVAFEEEEEESQSTTDAFSNSNYTMPGEDVPKSGPNSNGGTEQQKPHGGTDIIIPPGGKKKAGFKTDYKVGTSPIKASPFLTRNKKNKKRRVGSGGRANTANPDFAAMLRPGTNKSLSDVYDKGFLKNPMKREGLEMNVDGEIMTIGENELHEFKPEVSLPREMVSIISNLKEHLLIKSGMENKLLNEEILLDSVDMDEDEFLINEVLDNDTESFNEEKSLKSIIEDDEDKNEETIELNLE